MGWSTEYTNETIEAFIARFSFDMTNEFVKRIQDKVPFKISHHFERGSNGGVLYSLIPIMNKGAVEPFVRVTLIQAEHNGWSYKEMGMDCGPYNYGASREQIETLLSHKPLEEWDKFSSEWIQHCITNLRRLRIPIRIPTA